MYRFITTTKLLNKLKICSRGSNIYANIENPLLTIINNYNIKTIFLNICF